MNNEKIIQTIKKVLALSKNNPSEEEGKAAAMKAQELLAKYHLDIEEVEGIDSDTLESIDEVKVNVPAKKWKYELARIVARNFRCKHFYYGKGCVVFYGHKTDAEVAAETFKYLFKIGDKNGNRARNENFAKTHSLDNSGVYNSYVMGFCKGIDEALSVQCQALALVIPPEVVTSYEDRIKGFRRMSGGAIRMAGGISGNTAYESGRVDGHYAVRSRQLE